MKNIGKFGTFCSIHFAAKLSNFVNIPTVRWNTDSCMK